MERIPEPELMDEPGQAAAYAAADFTAPHTHFVELFRAAFGEVAGVALDLGCGPADVTIRFARDQHHCRVHGVDGAAAMLAHGHEAVRRARLDGRVRLIRGYLPGASLPQARYDAVISNSLLHHLHEPMALWTAVQAHARPGAPILVMDLMRPASRSEAEAMVARYAAGEPPVLQRDFFHSLLAAYRPAEVQAQLAQAGLAHLQVQTVSDRHLVVSGRA